MADEETNASQVRERTDESLRDEREKVDRVIDAQHVVEDDADEWVRHSREESDANVNAARDRADKKQAGAGQGKELNAAVVEARELEDEALQDERASADESLRREREEIARALQRLFPFERSKTDRNLLIERARSDDALSNRDDFMGMASHDLRNLLGGIAISVGNIARRVSDNEEGRKILVETNRIERFTARMNRLLGDLVDVTRIDVGKLRVVPEQADAAKLIADAVEIFEAPASARGITLKAEMIQPYIPAQFDYDRMLQVLANLITNAITFSYKDGIIRVRGELAGDEVLVSVSDTGCGIREDMLTAIFERFWHVGQNHHKGLGLGLYISRCIVEAHGGRIWVESTVDEGSTFSFTIPCTADKERVEAS